MALEAPSNRVACGRASLKIQALGGQVGSHVRQAGHIATWSRQACHVSNPDRI